jgi:hypothetical protein
VELADCPQSPELSSALKRLGVECFGDVAGVSLQDFRAVSEVASAVALELGCLVRQAERVEFGVPPVGPPADEALPDKVLLVPKWTGPTEPPSETTSITDSVRGLPLSMFQIPGRLRNVLLNLLRLSQAGKGGLQDKTGGVTIGMRKQTDSLGSSKPLAYHPKQEGRQTCLIT